PYPLPWVLHGMAPDPGIPEPVHEVAMELAADVFDGAPGPDDEGLLQVCSAALGLQVYPHEPEPAVDLVLHLLHVITGMGRDEKRRIPKPREDLLFDCFSSRIINEVDLVHRDKRGNVYAVGKHRID